MSVRSSTRVPLSCCAMSYCIFLCINVGSSWCCGEGCPCLRNSVHFVGAVAAGKYFNSTNNIFKSPPCRGSSTRPDIYEPTILTIWSRASINYRNSCLSWKRVTTRTRTVACRGCDGGSAGHGQPPDPYKEVGSQTNKY